MNKTGKIAAVNAVAMPAVKLLVSLKDIKNETAALKLVMGDTQQRTHVLACSVLKHVAQHRNINVLTQFLDAMPDMVRVNSIKLWFETFGGLTFGPANEGDKPSWRFDASKKVQLGEAMVKPFWRFKATEGTAYVPLDYDAWMKRTVAQLEKDAKATGRDFSGIIMALKTHKDDVKAGIQH